MKTRALYLLTQGPGTCSVSHMNTTTVESEFTGLRTVGGDIFYVHVINEVWDNRTYCRYYFRRAQGAAGVGNSYTGTHLVHKTSWESVESSIRRHVELGLI